MAHRKTKNINYDDNPSRKFIKNIFEHKFGIKLKDGKHKKIDLIKEDDEIVGVEVEHGHWEGDLWTNDQYSRLAKLEFRTVNIPIRKAPYWEDIVNNEPNPSAEHNIFVRTNMDFSQFIIIRPETIRNPEKAIKTKFLANNNDVEEDWLSFKKEDVETYNLINGEFILDQ
jgi:hypothetical protein